ncbi:MULTISPECIES: hypothetical protein [Halobacillus]|uniref:hypothetical protein n=1 Tax=Halobacillus TaxID=45667 RepID=UPI0009A5A5E1|nr:MULTISPECIES: hypothetical protein [Halobacillus]
MKQYFIIGALILSNVIFLLLYIGALSTDHQASANEKEEREITKGEKQGKTEKGSEESLSQDKEKFIKDTFKTLFDYGNEDYLTRFEVVKGEVSKDVIQTLNGMGGGEVPKVKFQNNVKGIKVYVASSPPDKENTKDVLVYMTSSYEIEGSTPSERHQLFRAGVKTKNDGYIITALESYGYIQPVSQS